MSKFIKPQASRGSVDLATLDQLLFDLTRAHHDLLSSIRSHKDAMRRTDLAGMADALSVQSACIERIATLEQQRNNLAKSFQGSTSGRGPLSISDMARSLGGEGAESLLARASELRSLMHQVQREQGALAIAATQLAAHVDGLMRLVVQKLSSAGVYGRSGRVDVPRAALSLDLKS